MLDPDAPARLLFVAPNLGHAATQLDADADRLLRWVALHEITHALQFGGVPWLRPHLAGMVRDLTGALTVDPGQLFAGVPGLDDLKGLVDTVREDGLAAAVLGPERRAQLDGVQAFMARARGLRGARHGRRRRRRDRGPGRRCARRSSGGAPTAPASCGCSSA